MPIPENKQREHRIQMEIIVDCYNEEEQAMGWYSYPENEIHFPFKARCVAKRPTSPLKVGGDVEVSGMAADDDCMHDMLVTIRWQDDELAVPLSQLEGIKLDKKSRQAVEDWKYWVGRGYEL